MNNTLNVKVKDENKLNRILYVIEAGLEYFIALGISTTYLPIIGGMIGMGKELITIVSSIISLGCGFQLFSVFVADKVPVKKWVTVLHIISQIFFSLLWFVPTFGNNALLKTVIFIVVIISAYFMHNLINSPKINWYMSFIDDDKRGGFTAIKEIVSLISGTLFTFAFGYLVDHISSPNTLCIVCGSILLFFSLCHTIVLFLSKEKTYEKQNTKSGAVKRILKNKNVLKISVLGIVRCIVLYANISFFATYQYGKDVGGALNLSATAVSVIVAISALLRVLLEKVLGNLGDKKSFSKMLNVCYLLFTVALMVNLFMLPDFGKNSTMMDGLGSAYSVLACFLFYTFYNFALAGFENGEINIMYDYVEKEDRTSALAIIHGLSGIAGFLSTLFFTFIGTFWDKVDLFIFGAKIYFQQVLALMGIILLVLLIVYNKFVIQKLKKPQGNKN